MSACDSWLPLSTVSIASNIIIIIMVTIEAVVSEEGERFTVEVMDISDDVWYSTPSLYQLSSIRQ